MKNILVVGANGMLGHDLVKVFSDKGYNVTASTREEFDITKIEEVEDFFKDKNFDIVVNSAAYTQVDKAEEEIDLAFLVNNKGAENLAKVTNKKNIPIIYISTDYVFDGTKNEPYRLNDKTNPISIYGKSKLAGEIATKKENSKYYITRTSWLYGRNGKNFVETMLELSRTRDEIKVVNDQFGCPTWTVELARGIERLIGEGSEFGTYHVCAQENASWYEFAKQIFEFKKIDINVTPVKTDEFPSLANRPSYSVMENSGLLRSWKEALGEYLS